MNRRIQQTYPQRHQRVRGDRRIPARSPRRRSARQSQPGVSRAIARLEARLKIRLFDRTTRSVALTDDGRRFFEHVMPHLAGLEEAAATASEGATAVRGRLRVNLDPIFSRLLLGPKLDAFLKAHPDLQLELIERSSRRHDRGRLRSRRAFRRPRDSSLVARKLLDTPVRTVAAPSYIRRRGKPAMPQALAQDAHTCIEFRHPEKRGRPFVWEFHRKKKRHHR